MTIHIEICKSEYKANCWNIRIGDLVGSTTTSNISKKDLFQELKTAINAEEAK